MDVDVDVRADGAIVLFTPVSDEAREWMRQNLQTEPWQWLGQSLAVERRYALPIVEGMQNAGLTTEAA